jgi:hypothetical protein
MCASDTGALDLVERLEILIADERRLSALRRRLHDQIDGGFPNPAVVAAEQRVSAERRLLHERIDALRAELARAEWQGETTLEERRRRLAVLGEGP